MEQIHLWTCQIAMTTEPKRFPFQTNAAAPHKDRVMDSINTEHFF